jgi:DNA-binding response OmpR family regulator
LRAYAGLVKEAPLVLVVEDDDSVRGLVAEFLREEGMAVAPAANGAQAIKLALDDQPDLVVLDVLLPDVDGVALAHQLRAICGLDLPILAMTADEEIAKRAFEMGAYSLLEKPFEFEHLLLAVRRGLLQRAQDQPGTIREDAATDARVRSESDQSR